MATQRECSGSYCGCSKSQGWRDETVGLILLRVLEVLDAEQVSQGSYQCVLQAVLLQAPGRICSCLFQLWEAAGTPEHMGTALSLLPCTSLSSDSSHMLLRGTIVITWGPLGSCRKTSQEAQLHHICKVPRFRRLGWTYWGADSQHREYAKNKILVIL